MSPVVEESKKFTGQEAFKADAETYHILQSLVETKKEQLQELHRTMSAEYARHTQILHDGAQAKKNLEGELKTRRVEFERDLDGERLKLQSIRRELEQSAADLAEQRKEADRFIRQGEAIRAEAQKLVTIRIEMERQRVQFETDKTAAEAIINVSHDQKATLERLEHDLEERQKRVESEEQSLASRTEALNTKETALAIREQQVALVKQEIDPKLEALSVKQSALQEQQGRLDALQREAQEQKTQHEQQAATLEGTRQQLEAKQQHARETELRLQAWERELRQKAPASTEGLSTP